MHFFNEAKIKQLLKDALQERSEEMLKLSADSIVYEIKSTLRGMIIAYSISLLLSSINILILQNLGIRHAIRLSKHDFQRLSKLSRSDELTEIQKKLIEQWGNASVLFMGPPGTGKSTIMTNIAKKALQNGSTIYSISPEILSPTKYMGIEFAAPIQKFKGILHDAKQQALKSGNPSYILIDEIHLTPIYNDFVLKFNFLHYTNDEEYKKYVRVLATTTKEDIEKDIYRQPGRLHLVRIDFYTQKKEAADASPKKDAHDASPAENRPSVRKAGVRKK